MIFKPGPPQTRLLEVVWYDPDTGTFVWLRKPGNYHEVNRWNSRHAGTRAGAKNRGGYIDIRIDGVMYRAHRLAWLYVHGTWPDVSVDHINGICDDNRIANLRLATRAENMKNAKLNVRNRSGFKGVYQRKNKWVAEICSDNRKYNLGRFESPEAASEAYERAARDLHGKFARK